MVRVCFIGHCTIDNVCADGEAWRSIGGSVVYASLAARFLSADAAIVTKVGPDFPPELEDEARKIGIDISRFKTGKATTRFALMYKGEARELRLISRGDDISPSEVALEKADAIHLGPVAGEVGVSVAEEARRRADIVSVDLQGLVRDFENGRVIERKRVPTEFLRCTDVAGGSAAELEASVGARSLREAVRRVSELGPKVVIATAGARGVLALVGKSIYRIPAFRTARVVDCTGAGDAFMGAFVTEYARGRDPIWSMSLGSAVASALIETRGPEIRAGKSEVYERAELILSGVKLISTF